MSDELLPNNHLTQNIDEEINPPTSPNQPIPQNKVPQPSSTRRFKALKIILGIVTFCPTFSTVIFLLILLFQMNSVTEGGLLIIPIIVLFGYFLIFTYIIIVFFNSRISKKQKALWVVLFSLGFKFPILPLLVSTVFIDIAMSIYWYFYIWKEPKQNQLS